MPASTSLRSFGVTALTAALAAIAAIGCGSGPMTAAEAQRAGDRVYRSAAQARIDPAFRLALSEYEAAAERAEVSMGNAQEVAIVRAIERLASAIERLPGASRENTSIAAMRIWQARTSALVGFQDEEASRRALHDALFAASSALDDAARGVYSGSSGVRTSVDAFRSAVSAVYDPTTLRGDRASVLDALDKAKFALRSVLSAATAEAGSTAAR